MLIPHRLETICYIKAPVPEYLDLNNLLSYVTLGLSLNLSEDNSTLLINIQ